MTSALHSFTAHPPRPDQPCMAWPRPLSPNERETSCRLKKPVQIAELSSSEEAVQ